MTVRVQHRASGALFATRNLYAGPAAVALAYLLTAYLRQALAGPAAPVSLLWSGSAVLFAALLFASRSRWWMYLVAVLPAHFVALLPAASFEQTAIQYVGNCAEAMLGAAALLHFSKQPRSFDTLSPMVALIVIGGIIAPFSTSVVMAAASVVADPNRDFWLVTIVRTLSHTLSTIVLVPLIAGLLRYRELPRSRLPKRTALEACVLGFALVVLGIEVFVLADARNDHLLALLYTPIPLLMWAAVRFGTLGTCASLLLLRAVATWGMLQGYGPFPGDLADNVISLALFLSIISVPLLLLAAVVKEKENAAEALVEIEVLHRSVLRSLQTQVAVLDKNGVILEVNESWRRAQRHMRMHVAVTAPGRNYLAAISEGADDGDPTCAAVRRALANVMEGLASHRQIEFSLRTPDGLRWFEQSIELLQRPEGGVVITLNDVTVRRRAEMEVHEQQKQLAHLARVAVLGEFSGAIAHEIRQPLTAILANAEAAALLLKRQPPDLAQMREIVEDIVADDLRADEVIRRLHRMLCKAETQRVPVRLNDLVDDCLRLARSDLGGRRILVNLCLQHELPCVVVDRVQIQQVILNLIANACDAMSDVADERRRLSLTTRGLPGDAEVEVVVTDQGGGIAAQLESRLFDSFVTTKKDGLGLGLSISKSIVVAHGGSLWAENVSSGAAFHVVLPISLH